MQTARNLRLPAAMVCASLLAAPICAATAAAATDPPDWSPAASEKLIKLPGDYLKRAVDNDFARSGLAAALIDLDRNIRLKQQSLADLQAAIERARGEDSGDLRVELEHQFLEEKRNYISMMQEHQDLRAKRAETKMRLYERLLGKLNRQTRAVTPQQADLLAKQTAARERFETSVAQIDTKLLRSSMTSESRYAREYAKNLAAIETLVQAVNAHPMNQAPEIDGQPVGRAEYLRQLIAENQADLAVVDQERSILGYMAKLVSLDALALSEGIATDEESAVATVDDREETGVSGAVEFFVQR